MTRVAIFGGTGMTGQHVVKYAIEKGLLVRLLVRDESSVPTDIVDKVELVKGDVTNLSDVENTIKSDVDLVVCTLGTRNKLDPTTMMSTGAKNIIEAMKKQNLKKASFCLSSFLFWDESKLPQQFLELNADHKRMLEVIKASGIEYRAILPPHIANEPSGAYTVEYDKSPGRSISIFDLSKFFIDSLFIEEHAGKVIGLATTK